ncbi:G protein-coupled glucose receptor regulating Gpa2 C-term [Ascochyta rabiei]|nr:G protein-coupled glucose receptor regulating Gpa2 C-term [Ascochyta rabiei]UPX18998.1 G protein-coupled glucose receptor regulating Gpa2 C-term [Ascochyta rabiei]
MEKRFRHRLIVILIYGDLMRGTWLFVFAIISLARGTVRTPSTFCQVSGFLVQYGTQTSDYAVLVMALHSALQVFYPSTLVSSDGLYPYRRYVYVGAFAIPILMAGLAFINPVNAYVSQGAFCTLPIRPFWYRLALSWIPRYIIILIIIGLAIAIYAHVGFEIRAYSNVDQSLLSLKTSDDSTTRQNDKQNDIKMEDITFELSTMQPLPNPQNNRPSAGHEIFTPQHQASSAPGTNPFTTPGMHRVSFDNDNVARSLPGSTLNLNRSRTDAIRPALFATISDCSVTAPVSPLNRDSRSTGRPDNAEPTAPPLSSSTSTRLSSPSSAQDYPAKQRQRIHRQLRLMFIYPIVYTLMWATPFVMHCMNYWDKWAMDPVEFLRVGGAICITLMGFADALIFSIREKPWRGVEGSDGTFWSSFVCWKSQGTGDAGGDWDPGQEGQSAGVRGGAGAGRTRGSTSYRTSASGDFARIAAEQARARLDIERGERLAALEFKQRAGMKEERHGHKANKDKAGYDGVDVGDGKKGQVYDDNGLEDDTA